MFRLSSKLLAIVMCVVGLGPCLAFAEIKQETLTAEGFPAAWKPGDFAIGKEIISGSTPAVIVSGTLISPTMVVAKVNAAALDGLGILNLGTGGEAPDVWQKSGRPEAELGLGRAVAQGVASPAMREGWRRLLLTEAGAPKAADNGVRPGWLAVRGKAMQKLGLYEAAWGLWKTVPAVATMDDATALGWVQAQLLAGQGREACPFAKSRALAVDNNGDWGIVMAVCQILGDVPNQAAASLSLQVVEPMLKARNPALLRILNAVQDGKPVTNLGGPAVQMDALGGAVLAAYPALVGPEVLPRMPDVALRRLVGSAALPIDLRGRAAVALARQTSLPQDGVTAWKLVSDTTFSGVMPDAVIVAKGSRDVSGTDAREFVNAALRLGMTDAAAKVMPIWGKQEGLNATESRERVQSQLTLAVLQGKVDDRLWDLWMLGQALDSQSGVRQAQRTLLVIEGLGIGVPSRVWQQMRDRAVPVSTLVDPAWQRLLASVVHEGNIPAVLGLVSEAWNGQPPAGVVPVMMGASIEALRRIGMDDVARRIAVEAMLGIPASHLIPLVPEKLEVVSASQPVAIGADAQAPTRSAIQNGPLKDGEVLPPPRVEPVKKPTVKAPTIKMPTKPIMPKAGG